MKTDMMKMTVMAFLGILVCASSVYAEWGIGRGGPNQDGEGPHGPRGQFEERKNKILEEVIEELDLSDEQKSLIEKQRQENQEKRQALREEVKASREKLRIALEEKEVDEKAIDQLIDEMAVLHKKRMRAHVDSILKVRSILTEEQYQELQRKLEIKREVFKELMKMRRGRHQDGGFGRRRRM